LQPVGQGQAGGPQLHPIGQAFVSVVKGVVAQGLPQAFQVSGAAQPPLPAQAGEIDFSMTGRPGAARKLGDAAKKGGA
jgi:hypothetical protein